MDSTASTWTFSWGVAFKVTAVAHLCHTSPPCGRQASPFLTPLLTPVTSAFRLGEAQTACLPGWKENWCSHPGWPRNRTKAGAETTLSCTAPPRRQLGSRQERAAVHRCSQRLVPAHCCTCPEGLHWGCLCIAWLCSAPPAMPLPQTPKLPKMTSLWNCTLGKSESWLKSIRCIIRPSILAFATSTPGQGCSWSTQTHSHVLGGGGFPPRCTSEPLVLQ